MTFVNDEYSGQKIYGNNKIGQLILYLETRKSEESHTKFYVRVIRRTLAKTLSRERRSWEGEQAYSIVVR